MFLKRSNHHLGWKTDSKFWKRKVLITLTQIISKDVKNSWGVPMEIKISQISTNILRNQILSPYYQTMCYFRIIFLRYERRAIRRISVNFSNIPTQAVWSSLGTSSPIAHMAHLSSKSWIDPVGHLQSSGFSEVGTLSPGQMPKNFYEM